jgi:molybdenum cofactor cytidylyltransferase
MVSRDGIRFGTVMSVENRQDVDEMMLSVTCVVLAAGESRRFGRNKLVDDAGGETLLRRAVRCAGAFALVVVASPENARYLTGSTAHVVLNDRPDLGMAYSLQLADAAIDADRAIAVVPADLALIEPEHVAAAIAAADADVTYPQRSDGTPGHPVVFSPRARSGIAGLPAGDTIKRLRDRPDLTRRILAIEEPWPYLDVDEPLDQERIGRNR